MLYVDVCLCQCVCMLDSGFALPAATFLLTLSHTRQIPAQRSGLSVECEQGNALLRNFREWQRILKKNCFYLGSLNFSSFCPMQSDQWIPKYSHSIFTILQLYFNYTSQYNPMGVLSYILQVLSTRNCIRQRDTTISNLLHII